jgi:hypothetical protein
MENINNLLIKAKTENNGRSDFTQNPLFFSIHINQNTHFKNQTPCFLLTIDYFFKLFGYKTIFFTTFGLSNFKNHKKDEQQKIYCITRCTQAFKLFAN